VQRMGITHPSWRRNRTPAPGEDADAVAVEERGPIG
jgi:hypothetical protein